MIDVHFASKFNLLKPLPRNLKFIIAVYKIQCSNFKTHAADCKVLVRWTKLKAIGEL